MVLNVMCYFFWDTVYILCCRCSALILSGPHFTFLRLLIHSSNKINTNTLQAILIITTNAAVYFMKFSHKFLFSLSVTGSIIEYRTKTICKNISNFGVITATINSCMTSYILWKFSIPCLPKFRHVFIITTLIRAFFSSRVDYCCSVLIGSPRSVTDKLQRVLNAAARVITNNKKYESGLSRIMALWPLLAGCYWADSVPSGCKSISVSAQHVSSVPDWTVYAVTASASRRGSLRSVTASNLVVPRCRLSTYSTRAFSVAGPVCWHSLPDYLKSSDFSFDCFKPQLKHFHFVNIDISTTVAH